MKASFLKVKIKKVPGHLYYPKELPLQPLYQTLAEQLYAWQWHYYQVPQTTVTTQDVVLDCGCAEGSFTFLIQSTAKHIYAIEPLPAYVKGLQKTFAESNNVSIIEKALGSKQEQAYIKNAGIASAITDEPTNTPVTIDTLDNVCRDY